MTIKKILSISALIGLLSLSSSLQAAPEWRSPDPENTLYMAVEDGTVVIELNPQFAPETVKQIKSLARSGFYDGKRFYRVIDGFVAQGGSGEDDEGPFTTPDNDKRVKVLPMENAVSSLKSGQFTLVQNKDLFADQTGFVQGFGAGRNQGQADTWLTHCPGVIGMSRSNDPVSATTDFYIVIGQAPRYLDNIMTLFGRVVYGMDAVQRIKRATLAEGGMIADTARQSRIDWVKVAADLPVDKRLPIEIERTDTQAFKDKLQARIDRKHAFFYNKPPRVLDVCQVPVATRLKS